MLRPEPNSQQWEKGKGTGKPAITAETTGLGAAKICLALQHTQSCLHKTELGGKRHLRAQPHPRARRALGHPVQASLTPSVPNVETKPESPKGKAAGCRARSRELWCRNSLTVGLALTFPTHLPQQGAGWWHPAHTRAAGRVFQPPKPVLC